MKLSALLAKTDSLSPVFINEIKAYQAFFKNSQSAFQGEKKTYDPAPNTVDVPNLRGETKVQTTVKEKLDYFTKTHSDYLQTTLDQEATNASGGVKVDLIVGGKSFGKFSSMELLKLQSLFGNPEFKHMLEAVPVRSDAKRWQPISNTESEYYNREIVESPEVSQPNRTTEKEQYIMRDPNFEGKTDMTGYVPREGVKNTTVHLGVGTTQNFSGEWTQHKKAEILGRRTAFLTAIKIALKECNDIEAMKSEGKAEEILSWMFFGEKKEVTS